MSSSYASRTERIERYLSLGVGVAVIAALLVSLYQANLARAQLRASAWPYLAQSNSWATGDYQWVVTNDGVGPARIRSMRILVDGKAMRTWNDAVRALTGEGEARLTYSSTGRGTVIPAGASRVLLTMPKGERATRFWSEGQTRLRAVTCYCSVYDECWIADSDRHEPAPTDRCAVDEAAEFRQ